MIELIVDSICDLPEELMNRYNIKMLPLRVSIDNVEYIDKVNIELQTLYTAMKNGIVPKTSQVNIGDTYNLFSRLCEEGKDFIFLTFSSKLSGTNASANTIVNELKETYPNRNMKVIDSKGGAGAIGLIALQLAKLIEADYDFQTIINEGDFMSNHIEHLFSITDLEWLAKGGRISKTSAAVGGLLNIKPILNLEDGEIKVTDKVRGEKKVLNTIVNMVKERTKNFHQDTIALAHSDDLDRVLKLKDLLQSELGISNFILTPIGSVLTTHLGIGGIGVFFFNEKPKHYIQD